MSKPTVYLGTDHAGFELKENIKAFLKSKGYKVKDLGNWTYEELDDYPDFIRPVAKKVAASPKTGVGIIFGGSAQGEAIAANRVRGARAAVYYGGPLDIVTLSREHNNANILSLGARFMTPAHARKVVLLWLRTKFTDEARHMRRIRKIEG